MLQEIRLYDFCSEFLFDIIYFWFGGGGGGGGGRVVTVVAVAVLVAAAATMMSNEISLQGTRDQEHHHLLHSFLEHKSYSFWHYKVTVGGTAFHP